MKIIISLLAALAAIFAIAPAAHAQSSQNVQIKRMDFLSYASSVNTDGTIGFAVDNNNDFRQRFVKEKVGGNVFRFSRAGFNSCIRDVGEGNVMLGSCNGGQAQWIESSFGGGKLYQNPASGRYLTPGFCFGLCPERMLAQPKANLDPWGGLKIALWKLDLL